MRPTLSVDRFFLSWVLASFQDGSEQIGKKNPGQSLFIPREQIKQESENFNRKGETEGQPIGRLWKYYISKFSAHFGVST